MKNLLLIFFLVFTFSQVNAQGNYPPIGQNNKTFTNMLRETFSQDSSSRQSVWKLYPVKSASRRYYNLDQGKRIRNNYVERSATMRSLYEYDPLDSNSLCIQIDYELLARGLEENGFGGGDPITDNHIGVMDQFQSDAVRNYDGQGNLILNFDNVLTYQIGKQRSTGVDNFNVYVGDEIDMTTKNLFRLGSANGKYKIFPLIQNGTDPLHRLIGYDGLGNLMEIDPSLFDDTNIGNTNMVQTDNVRTYDGQGFAGFLMSDLNVIQLEANKGLNLLSKDEATLSATGKLELNSSTGLYKYATQPKNYAGSAYKIPVIIQDGETDEMEMQLISSNLLSTVDKEFVLDTITQTGSNFQFLEILGSADTDDLFVRADTAEIAGTNGDWHEGRVVVVSPSDGSGTFEVCRTCVVDNTLNLPNGQYVFDNDGTGGYELLSQAYADSSQYIQWAFFVNGDRVHVDIEQPFEVSGAASSSTAIADQVTIAGTGDAGSPFAVDTTSVVATKFDLQDIDTNPFRTLGGGASNLTTDVQQRQGGLRVGYTSTASLPAGAVAQFGANANSYITATTAGSGTFGLRFSANDQTSTITQAANDIFVIRNNSLYVRFYNTDYDFGFNGGLAIGHFNLTSGTNLDVTGDKDVRFQAYEGGINSRDDSNVAVPYNVIYSTGLNGTGGGQGVLQSTFAWKLMHPDPVVGDTVSLENVIERLYIATAGGTNREITVDDAGIAADLNARITINDSTADGNSVDYTMPANPEDGDEIFFKIIGFQDGANIVLTGGQTIDGQASFSFTSLYDALTVEYDANKNEWYIK